MSSNYSICVNHVARAGYFTRFVAIVNTKKAAGWMV